MIPLANQLPDQQVAVQQVQGGEQGGGGGCAALLQLQAHPEQLLPGHLCGSGSEKGRQLYIIIYYNVVFLLLQRGWL